jgi:hypothetical protein
MKPLGFATRFPLLVCYRLFANGATAKNKAEKKRIKKKGRKRKRRKKLHGSVSLYHCRIFVCIYIVLALTVVA